jgi:hypothetical protein
MDLLQSCAIETAFVWPTWSSGHAMTVVLLCRQGHWQPHQAVGVDCCQHKCAISCPYPGTCRLSMLLTAAEHSVPLACSLVISVDFE